MDRQVILIATKNKGKLQEFSRFLSGLPAKVVSLSDVGISDDVEEDGQTYEENSRKKALFYVKKSGLPAVSDDGGLEIAALGGAPGVKSRRWLGYEATDEELLQHMQKVAKAMPDNNRDAFFRTVVSLALPDGRVWSEQGEVKGVIVKEPFRIRSHGYPYRSFFFLPECRKYYHEQDLDPDEMARYNHRLKAIRALMPHIKEVLSR